MPRKKVHANVHALEEIRRAIQQLANVVDEVPQNTFVATVPPDEAIDDITQGWTVGSLWLDVSSNYIYQNIDSTEGAAKWKQLVDLVVGSASGGVAGAPVTLGRLLAEDTNGAWGRLTAGANNEIVIYDSSETLGVKSGTVTSILAGSIFFEVYMRAITGTVYASMYDETSDVAVADSEVSTSSSSFVLVRSPALTLTTDRDYRMRFGVESGDHGKGLGGAALGI